MKELKAGQITELTVLENNGSRWILTNGEIKIPLDPSEVTAPLKIGDRIKVFLYGNRRGELSATMMLPQITPGSYGWAKVLKVTAEGAFTDIGTSREVLVKAEDLPKLRTLWPKAGDHLCITLYTNRKGELFGRLITEEKVKELYEKASEQLFNKNVKARAYRLLPVGSFLLGIDVPYRIFVHHSEMEAEPRLGQDVEVRIIAVKEDGTMNGSLLPRSYERLEKDAEKIYEYLKSVGGKMPFSDESTPEEIYAMFDMSKGAFKRALGVLMKQKKVQQKDGWTEIL
ncbi:S1-like domain-containing RNA-binding protein [Ureibacillus sp. FSL K6-8385]|nr:S1-like domain-containing RNA-binding protein [Ureibacillus terrenus]MED3662249.1 S1-like domain-containing RNA-binding protein [Ureibacillus terrenus]MED3764058.1 S1-like domain-containing RNA-binding protein [Ureibacillus terrenus]